MWRTARLLYQEQVREVRSQRLAKGRFHRIVHAGVPEHSREQEGAEVQGIIGSCVEDGVRGEEEGGGGGVRELPDDSRGGYFGPVRGLVGSYVAVSRLLLLLLLLLLIGHGR